MVKMIVVLDMIQEDKNKMEQSLEYESANDSENVDLERVDFNQHAE